MECTCPLTSPFFCPQVMTASLCWGLAVLLVASAVAPRAAAETIVDAEVPGSQDAPSQESVMSMASCIADKEAVRCLHRRALR